MRNRLEIYFVFISFSSSSFITVLFVGLVCLQSQESTDMTSKRKHGYRVQKTKENIASKYVKKKKKEYFFFPLKNLITIWYASDPELNESIG